MNKQLTTMTEEIRMAQWATEVLGNYYPGNLWGVHVDMQPPNATMTVKAFNISKSYGYLIHLKNATMYANAKSLLINAGGEILERAGMKRGGNNDFQTPEFIEGVKKSKQPIPGIGAI